MSQSELGRSTLSIHGSSLKDAHGAPHMPIYNTTTFGFDSTEALLDVVDGRKPGALYTRFGLNPTTFALEETMAKIERTEVGLAFCSGMAAETAIFAQYGRNGIICIGDAYGGTMELLSDQLPLFDINTTFLLSSELDQLEAALEAGSRLVFFETPTNPTLEVFDIAEISELVHRYGALLAIDNTFASPINQRPLELGADLVVYSATKYLGGHSDVTAGFVLGSKKLVTPLFNWRKNFGMTIAPEPAALLSRSLRTLTIRVEAQNRSAKTIAEALQVDPRIARVLYPGLPTHPNHELATKQMHGYGGMLTIEIKADEATTSKVIERLELFALAPSLGGTESVATQPSTITHHGVDPQERARRGITDSMIRLSIGLEDTDDLLADLTRALDEVDA